MVHDSSVLLFPGCLSAVLAQAFSIHLKQYSMTKDNPKKISSPSCLMQKRDLARQRLLKESVIYYQK